jgi:hypothetical protein
MLGMVDKFVLEASERIHRLENKQLDSLLSVLYERRESLLLYKEKLEDLIKLVKEEMDFRIDPGEVK